jgi:predicted tellurium resistance membrane protein TerC
MSGLFTAENLASLLSLTALEIILGIDNIVFLAILSQKLPPKQASKARRLGLVFALGTRVLLLLTLTWLSHLTAPLFTIASKTLSGRDLVLALGGLFLMAKSAHEIHGKTEEHHDADAGRKAGATMASVVVQIALLDVVFSLDSVITAVGMAPQLWIMIGAVILAMVVMLLTADQTAAFITRHPSLKVLGLSFLLLIGVLLVAESLGHHVPRGYVYFAMGFSLAVEMLNIRARRKHAAVQRAADKAS